MGLGQQHFRRALLSSKVHCVYHVPDILSISRPNPHSCLPPVISVEKKNHAQLPLIYTGNFHLSSSRPHPGRRLRERHGGDFQGARRDVDPPRKRAVLGSPPSPTIVILSEVVVREANDNAVEGPQAREHQHRLRKESSPRTLPHARLLSLRKQAHFFTVGY